MEQRRILIESYGCTMNHGEARIAGDLLQKKGYSVVQPGSDQDPDDWDKMILFTCDVISTTERRMYRRIDELQGLGKSIIVAGCLPAISEKELKERYPGIVLMDSMGLTALGSSLEHLFPDISEKGQEKGPGRIEDRIDTIVPISTGCAGSCSYCITRHARGGIRSYTHREIIRRIEHGMERGRREVLLTSQDTAAYGIDKDNGDLGNLLNDITSTVDGHYRMRIGMMNPVLISDKLDSIMDGFGSEKIFKFLHIPVQSGSDKILASMGREYSLEGYMGMVKRIRSRFPKITISTDLIIGFPGETEEDHGRSLDLISQLRPEVLNITRFSSRPGTRAHKMKGQINGGTMKNRSRSVSKVHMEVLEEILSGRSGEHRRCLVTEVGKPGTMMARDDNYTPIVVKAGPELLGRFIDVKTIETGPIYLIAGDNWTTSDI